MTLWITLLALQATVFVAWIVAMFRTLFRVRALAVRLTGQAMPGPAAGVRAVRAYLADPAQRPGLWRLAGLTCALLALSGAAVALSSPQGI